MTRASEKIRNQLFDNQEVAFRTFQQRLIPNVAVEDMIGVRTSVLRKLAKQLQKESPDQCQEFLQDLPHRYFEENNLHGIFIEEEKDLDQALRQTEDFLPYINNWATCDIFAPKVFKKHPQEVYEKIKIWLTSDQPYTLRYGVGLLLANYLDGEFRGEMLDLVAQVPSQEYYVHMMIAWYFSTALVKQYSEAVPYLVNRKLDKKTHNKAIQKAVESRRLDNKQKEYLKGLRWKEAKARR